MAEGRHARILVVDEDRSWRDELVRLLEEVGYEVRAVGEGLAALKLARSEPFDLVVLDRVVPGLDGLQLLRLLKQQGGGDLFLPVVLTSVRTDVASRVEALRLGADDFLSRPFEPLELVARVESLLRIRSMHQQVAAARRELEALTCTDDLTHLYNHRALQGRLREELARAGRYGRSLAVMVLDLDRFGAINEEWGHLAGDEVLRELGALLREGVRGGDVVARTGGATFVLLLPEASLDGTLALVHRLQEEMAQRSFGNPYASLTLSCSAGVALWPGEEAVSPEELLLQAGAALEAAKGEGGGIVRVHGQQPPPARRAVP